VKVLFIVVTHYVSLYYFVYVVSYIYHIQIYTHKFALKNAEEYFTVTVNCIFSCDSGTFPKETVVLGAWERLESYAKDIIEVSGILIS